jgi:hypothetical protein
MTETTQQSTTYPQPVHSAAAAREELSLRIFDLADALTQQAKSVRSIAEHVEAGQPLQYHDGATFTAAEAVSWVAEALAAITARADLSELVRGAAMHDVHIARAAEANWLISRSERDYVSALNATLAAPPDNREDYHRWTGMCQAYAEVDRAVRERHSFPEHMLRSKEWRSVNGVYSDAEVAQMHKGDEARRDG